MTPAATEHECAILRPADRLAHDVSLSCSAAGSIPKSRAAFLASPARPQVGTSTPRVQ